MPNLRALRRLLRVRTLEEEQRQAELEAVLAASHHLESMVAYQEQGSRAGRALAFTAIFHDEGASRLAGLEQLDRMAARASALAPALETAQAAVAEARQSYLASRVERRQAQSLIEAAERDLAVTERRRAQQQADDAHLRRRARSTPRDAA
ncbi:MAG TPA: hypothetical protein VF392_05855 [Terracidiphilus sp.]